MDTYNRLLKIRKRIMSNFDVPKAEHYNLSNDIIVYDDSDNGTYFCIMFYGIEIDAKWDKVTVELPTKIDFSNFNVLILLEDIEKSVDKLIMEKQVGTTLASISDTLDNVLFPDNPIQKMTEKIAEEMAKKEDENLRLKVVHRNIDPKSKMADNMKKAVAGIMGIDEKLLVSIDVKTVGKAN